MIIWSGINKPTKFQCCMCVNNPPNFSDVRDITISGIPPKFTRMY